MARPEGGRVPGDAERNQAAAEDLSALAKSLDSIPVDDPLWAEYVWVNDAAAETDESLHLVEWLSDRLRWIGFQAAVVADGRALLREFISENRREIEMTA